MSLIWKAWRNSARHTRSGAGYGLRIPISDRDRLFAKEWKTVYLELPIDGGYNEVEVNINKPSFWNGTCRELISHQIGRWLIAKRLAPWPKGRPPRIHVEHAGARRFRVKGHSTT